MNKIILIGGPPRCAKTTLAQKIAKETGSMWISTDILDDVVKECIPNDDLESLFPKTILRRKSGGSNDELYSIVSVEDVVSAYVKQSEAVHKAIKALILCANKEGWDYVIEGYHVTPKLISGLEIENKNISSAMLVNTKAEESIKRSVESTTKNDWLRDNTKKEETFEKIAEMIDLYSQKLIEESNKYNIKVVDIAENFQEKFDEAFEFVTQP